jgi:transmembrane 9 superfamily protein 2/4
MVAVIMLRTLRRDVLYYNRVPTEEERAEEKEESGWKLIHAHVFRPPTFSPMLFSVLVGTGSQLLGMSIFLILFAAIGFLSPANRGSLMIAFIALFVLMATLAGYRSATTYKMFGGEYFQRCTLATALTFPGASFVLFFIVNAVLWHVGSDGAVPFPQMFAVIALWLGVSLPLTFIGAYSGYKREKVAPGTPVIGDPIPIPPVQWYLSPMITIFVGGVLPFGVIFVELFFILSSLWLDQYYYVFGFLFIVFAMMILVCSELTIVLCYFQLCAEDYHWWWRSFLTSGCCALYVFLYCIFYFTTKLEVAQFVPGLVYFSYMFLMCVALFLVAGTAGHTACYWFVSAIYGALKVD